MPLSETTARFLAAFNRIEAGIRERIQSPVGQDNFAETITRFNEIRYFNQADYWFLLAMGRLRNVIIHDYNNVTHEYSIPAAQTVNRLERIAAALEAPEKLERRFSGGGVATVSPDQPLDRVLDTVRERAFSQFPVIENGAIRGLLTENGITRWLADKAHELSLIDFAEVTVNDVLEHEEPRQNMLVLSRYALFDEVRRLFIENRSLEAIIVTQSGLPRETPLGIVTRFDL